MLVELDVLNVHECVLCYFTAMKAYMIATFDHTSSSFGSS